MDGVVCAVVDICNPSRQPCLKLKPQVSSQLQSCSALRAKSYVRPGHEFGPIWEELYENRNSGAEILF
jgi:hypothetical protein